MRLSGSTSKGLKTAEIAASGKNGFVESLRNDDLDATHTSASPKSAVFLIGSVAIMAPRPRSSGDQRRHRNIAGFTRSLMRPFKILEFRAMNGPILDAAEFAAPPRSSMHKSIEYRARLAKGSNSVHTATVPKRKSRHGKR